MKYLVILTLLISWSLPLFSQPVNDDCSGLIDLGEAPICPVPDTFNNVSATPSVVFSDPGQNVPSCFTGGVIDRDVWFSFTVPTGGDITDFTIAVNGVDGSNGSIVHPQIAVYRGDCLLDELQELDCATAESGATEVALDLLGLTPGLPYFLRISDWSASALPNWGDFVLCVKEYDPVFNIGDVALTDACSGTLYDSGGPDGDYGNSENLTFTICPTDFHQCIFIDLTSFSIENDFDFLNFYAGDNTGAPPLTDITGTGGGIEIQAFSNCVTIQFTSDFSVTDAGFELNWMCSPDTCTIPPPITCDDPVVVPALPYVATGLTTCNAGDQVSFSPCNNNGWLDSEDYIFTYTSSGDECIAVSVTGSNNGTGIGVFNDCPSTATNCMAQSGGGAGVADPSINAIFLQDPGTYYIVVDNADNCTPFNIEIQQVSCPVVLPSAAFCENSLSINGCGELPAIVSVAPGQGDASFLQSGTNIGCWANFYPLNFTFFSFQAQTDGSFGFTMQSADPDEASDIDFLVWGPIADPADICEFASSTEPIRSSYAAGADPTGLADIHPISGATVTDVCEPAVGDDFVSTIQVQEGEYYLILVNDWGGQITSGAVSIDFGATTPGVLDALPNNFMVTPDTSVCPGNAAQLLASGGDVYQWFPADGLSCIYCPNPVATVTETITYSVVINSVCEADTLEVEVGFLTVDAGPDITVCLGEDLQLVAGSNFAGVQYTWDGPVGFLSCTDCPDPVITAIASGTFTFEMTANGPTCSFSDEMTLTVLPGNAPVYDISEDQAICEGSTVMLGGNPVSGVTYTWTSSPAGFASTEANPAVTPSETTTYLLEIEGVDCPLSSIDSVTVTVSAQPIIAVNSDTSICLGASVILGNTQPEPGVSYTWSPSSSLDDPSAVNPVATPAQTTQYTLTADRQGCINEATVNVEVIQLGIDILNDDTTGICRNTSVALTASAFPAGVEIIWSPDDGSLNATTGSSVTASPETATTYFAEVAINGCIKYDSVYIGVDSLPWDLAIVPVDTQICQGEQVLLVSPTYEPADFGQIEFNWTPSGGQLTPDSLYNMVVQPGQTTTYQRVSTNGFCSDTTTATVMVVDVSSVMIEPQQPVICAGETVQLTATSPIPVNFTWDPSAGLSCIECSDPVASPAATTTYMVEADFDGCPVGSSVTIEVVNPPAVQFPVPIICPGGSLALNLAPNSNYTYEWTSSEPGFLSTEPSPVVTPGQSGITYFVTVDNGICEPVNDSVTVLISANLSLDITEDTTVCTDAVLLTVSTGIPGGTYSWSDGQTGPSVVVALIEGFNLFTVEYSNICDTLTGDVEVEYVPGIEIISIMADPDTNVFYQGTPVVLSVETTTMPLVYEWSSGSMSDTALVRPFTLPSESYSVTVTDEFGCTDSETLDVEVLESLFDIPNVFTPNGDNVNDFFKVITTGENIEVESIRIWSRWGKMVHEEMNDNIGWDGTFNDEPMPSDVYVYYISIRLPDGSVFTEKGDLTLLR